MLVSSGLVLAGLALLIAGGDLLVRGAVNIAQALGLSPLVIGLTLVGFGTSTPELVTSLRAALADAPGIAYGNIVGSNIANILLILGGSALFVNLSVSRKALWRDGLVMLAVALAFATLAATTEMNRVVGAAAIFALLTYIIYVIGDERSDGIGSDGALLEKAKALEVVDPSVDPKTPPSAGLILSAGFVLGGLIAVVVGGYLLVDGAVALARAWEVTETIIGLTIVAVGTSAPELVTSLTAALRKQGEIAFGNIVGSNIYNILAIGGATALIAPSRVPEAIAAFDNLIMIGASVLLIAFAASGSSIRRWEGGALVAGYVLYIAMLWPR